MKKILGILFNFAIALQATAYEDLIMSCDDTIAQIKNKTPYIITVDTLTTLMNNRDTILVDTLKEGTGEFTLIFETGQIADFKLKIDEKSTQIIKQTKNFDVFVIDDYAKETEIDLPPGVKF